MWQNFTERGKRVFQLAHREALRLGHDVVGTEHILLGLLDDADGIVTNILASYGLYPEMLKAEIENLVGTEKRRPEPVDLPSSPRAKLVIDLAMREARKMGVNYIGTEHILLGILAEGEGMAAQLLASHGMDLPKTRMMVKNMLSGNQAEPESFYSKTEDAPPARSESQPQSRTPTLDQIGIDLTNMARGRELDPVIGRDKEIQRVVQILSRRTKNNPVLIGEPGVGKTAIAEGLAQRIISGEIPEILKDKRVMQLNVANLVAGTKYRGEFEERMRRIVKEVREAKK
ncbi:MAG: Clp protease N-terminal domain-containing protein, partial [Synergistaceae bacterium]|nr:Clp protease N-terminal domain-containing protein [Synergistaceae bacterium]